MGARQCPHPAVPATKFAAVANHLARCYGCIQATWPSHPLLGRFDWLEQAAKESFGPVAVDHVDSVDRAAFQASARPSLRTPGKPPVPGLGQDQVLLRTRI
jgi:hypothetical protein